MNALAFKEMDYSKRHCWPRNDGTYYAEGYPSMQCFDWQKHIERAGNTEFIRWIQAFTTLTNGEITGSNAPDGNLKLGVQWCATYGANIYCEDYGGKIKCFLDRENEVAVVEIYDDSILDSAMEAYNKVQQDYEDMKNVVAGNPA